MKWVDKIYEKCGFFGDPSVHDLLLTVIQSDIEQVCSIVMKNTHSKSMKKGVTRRVGSLQAP